MGQVALLLDASLVGELFDRLGPTADPSGIVESVLQDFLDRTRYDDELWRLEWIQMRDEREADQFVEKFGAWDEGYQWGPVFLRNGSRIRMSYQGVEYDAWVKHGRIEYEEEELSPSQFASRIAGGTARNAWRDLLVKGPGDTTWRRADELRRSALARAAAIKRNA